MRVSKRLIFFFAIILAFTSCHIAVGQTKSSIIINELMVNPNNVASLPAYEYIELYNNSEETVNLSNLILQVNNNQVSLPDYRLSSKQYIILCTEAAMAEFERFGNVITPSRWYALANTGASVRILYTDGTIIDQVSYRDNWYNNASKRNGGWSLERINPHWNCDLNINWSATQSLSGGTPGRINSISDASFQPSLQIINSEIKGYTLLLQFNIEAQYFDTITPENIILEPGTGQPSSVQKDGDQFILTFSRPLQDRTPYQLLLKNINLCNVSFPELSYTIFHQRDVLLQDILINEILFNPKSGGVDFVELYNNSSSPVNLEGFRLGNRIITSEYLLLPAKGYLALTTNKSILMDHYANAVSDAIFQVSAMPPYPNQQGIVVLYDNKGTQIDSVYYNESMHTPLITNPKGVSLERVSSTSTLFHSASTLVGGATPGYQNSTIHQEIKQNTIHLSSNTFSPNGDGFEDELEIKYELINPNYIITIEIFNEKGQLVQTLAKNKHAGSHGFLKWNGKNSMGSSCPQGHYICVVNIFNHEGLIQRFKQPFVLIHSLKRH